MREILAPTHVAQLSLTDCEVWYDWLESRVRNLKDREENIQQELASCAAFRALLRQRVEDIRAEREVKAASLALDHVYKALEK